MAKLTEEQFIKKLYKLFTKEMPDNLRAVYDSHQMRLFIIRDGYDFIDKGVRNNGTSWHGVLTPVNEPDGSEGNVADSVAGYLEIPLEAVIESNY